ncbi:hypothetical protein M2371_004296 [Buttiauxella sp. BIGb0471]|uniref:hypothetical protein n=1 Tax=Buttiauxella sp. BIGb0471 TaxID=2940597 RepID=UPI002167AD10|nr:hypothetical protein [Buttiauxella sp. BIGb0471]MCS3605042.1 hypothetical protein [Buttiauxella sp. BIGb0471]
MPRTPRKQPADARGTTAGSQKTFFQKGRAKTGGRKKRDDVWQMLERAAEIAHERQGNTSIEQQTADEFVADLIEQVKRISPETAMKTLAPLIYPKARYKPLDIEVDLTSDAGIAATLEKIALQMATGGDVASLEALFNTVSAVQQSRALALEMDLSRKELADGV